MSYTLAVAGLKTRLQTLVTSGDLKVVVVGVPTSAHNLPLAFIEADGGSVRTGGQLLTNEDRVRVSVLVPFMDNVKAEDQIGPFVDLIPATVVGTWGGAVIRGYVTDWTADYLDVGEVKTRRVWFTVAFKRQQEHIRGT